MTRARRILALSALLVGFAASPSFAQDHDGTMGYGGGGIWFGEFNAGGNGNTFGLDAGWVANAHVEHWMGSRRLGARLSTAFTRRPMETLDDVRNINTWLINGDLMLRLLPATPGRTVAPFLSAGVGVVSYGLGEGPSVILAPEGAVYPGDSDRRLSAVGGLGLDIHPGLSIWGSRTGIRLEVVDNVVLESPFEPLEGGEFDPIHNVRVSLSLIGLVDFLQ